MVVVAYRRVEARSELIGLASAPATGHGERKAIWRRFGMWLLLGLEFELAADIIGSVVSPTWQDIGGSGAIAVIRTFLNYFLEKDLEGVETPGDHAPVAPVEARGSHGHIHTDLPAATQLALDRTRLAHERTLMAWVRTSTSLISFGFTIYKFFQYLQRETDRPLPASALLGPAQFALMMIGIGLTALLLGHRGTPAAHAGAPDRVRPDAIFARRRRGVPHRRARHPRPAQRPAGLLISQYRDPARPPGVCRQGQRGRSAHRDGRQ